MNLKRLFRHGERSVAIHLFRAAPRKDGWPRCARHDGVLIALLGAALLLAPAFAVSDPAEMLPDPRQEARAEHIGSQLRCLVCQNESIEDSGASLAKDLRHMVRLRVTAGDTDQQVIDWMVARYGSFVRLKPPFEPATWLLWGSPWIALLAGGTWIWFARRKPAAPEPLSEEEWRKLTGLLEDR